MRIAVLVVAFLVALPAVQGDDTKLCPSDWTYYNETSACYKLSVYSYAYDDAQAYCASIGGSLSSVRILRELSFVANMTMGKMIQPWMGARSNATGTWYNVDGTPFSTFYWAKNEPNKAYNQTAACAVLQSVVGDQGLVAAPCYNVQPALCKQLPSVCNGGIIGTTRTKNGTFTSPNYPNNYYNNLDCYYQIQGPNNSYVSIIFDPYFVENSFDNVKVYNGWNNVSSQLLGSVTNVNDTKKSFETTSNQMLVVFHTDTSVVKAGWKATYTTWSTLPPIYSNGTDGVLSSRNYPNNYDPFLEQTYYISTYEGFRITITIDDFQTESRWDPLQVYAAANTNDPSTMVALLNGTFGIAPWTYVFPSNVATLLFITDRSLEYRGWHLTWSIVQP